MKDVKTKRKRGFNPRARMALAIGLTVSTALLTFAALILLKALPISIATYDSIQFAYQLNDLTVTVLIFTMIAVYLAQDGKSE